MPAGPLGRDLVYPTLQLPSQPGSLQNCTCPHGWQHSRAEATHPGALTSVRLHRLDQASSFHGRTIRNLHPFTVASACCNPRHIPKYQQCIKLGHLVNCESGLVWHAWGVVPAASFSTSIDFAEASRFLRVWLYAQVIVHSHVAGTLARSLF